MKESNATLNGEISTYNGLLQSGGSLNNQSNSLGMTDFTPIGSDGFSDLMTTTSEMDTMSMRATVSAFNVITNIYTGGRTQGRGLKCDHWDINPYGGQNG